jgi:hypothetical protein
MFHIYQDRFTAKGTFLFNSLICHNYRNMPAAEGASAEGSYIIRYRLTRHYFEMFKGRLRIAWPGTYGVNPKEATPERP